MFAFATIGGIMIQESLSTNSFPAVLQNKQNYQYRAVTVQSGANKYLQSQTNDHEAS